ncbi:YciI family protein [Serinicoccus kebangsaanensis]|uniref:YciI family protein n=1 Tax=Serinicoccus kebangsaanensis TaxID=2602069 RepID=UPI00124ED6CC|nr:YciI family protein [Serinicoccus kebangsaanensis]
MKYVVLLMADGELPAWSGMSEDEQGAMIEQFGEFDRACQAREGVEILAGEALGAGDTSTSIRTRAGERHVTDGPYAEAVEQLGGFYLLEAPDLDVVLELLTVLPAYDMQVSPVVDPY